jgi:hypothetical protein
MLWNDLRRNAPALDPGVLRRRFAGPLAVLLGINFTMNGVVYAVAPQGPDNPAGAVPTIALWGALSLFTGIFFGLIAQGRRPTTGSALDDANT